MQMFGKRIARLLSPLESSCMWWINAGRSLAEIAVIEGRSIEEIESCVRGAMLALSTNSLTDLPVKPPVGQHGGNLSISRSSINMLMQFLLCRGYLVMRQLGQLEMRQSRLLMHWSMPTSGARMTTSSLVETMSGRSRHVLVDHHVAERIASPRSHSKDP